MSASSLCVKPFSRLASDNLCPKIGAVDGAKNTGNIARQTLSFDGLAQPFVVSYKYDSLYRLTEAVEKTGSTANWSQQFGYDRYGNRTGINQAIGSLTLNKTPAVDAATNRFTSGQGFVYDKNGNVVGDTDINSSLPRQFTFNGDNKQTEVKKDGVTVGRYFYDGEGKRIKKITDTETTTFVYSAGKLIAEYSSEIASVNDAKVAYLTNDHLGSPRITTDATGQVISRHDYHPFGEEIGTLNGGSPHRTTALNYTTDSVRQKFTGYERDNETDLDFAQSRYYNKNHGRFTSPDIPFADQFQSNPQSWNLYSYARNNPLNLVDPLGMAADCPPGYPDCYERDGRYYIKDADGVEAEVSDEPPIVINTTIKRDGSNFGTAMLVTVPCPSNGCGNPDPGILPVPMGGVVNKGIGAVLTKVGNFIKGLFGFGVKTATKVLPKASVLQNALSKAKPVGDRLESVLPDGSKVIFRRDFGPKAHPIGSKYPNPVNHYNVEIHEPYRGGFKQLENIHLIVDNAGNVVDIIQ